MRINSGAPLLGARNTIKTEFIRRELIIVKDKYCYTDADFNSVGFLFRMRF